MTSGGEDLGEQELAARSRGGDRAAFDLLVRRTGRWIFARLFLQTGDVHRAQDLTQETFFAAWQQIARLGDPAAFRGWLWSIAQRKLLDAAKHDSRRKRRAPLAPSGDLDAVVHPSATPIAQADDEEQRQRAIETLQSLPEEYRLPLALRYLGGADYQTISEQLALSNGSLRGLLQRGMALLRERMKSNGEEVGGRQ